VAADQADAGGTQPGPWFHMVQTNASMSRLRIIAPSDAAQDSHLDDLTVRTNAPPFWQYRGSVFTFE
jgi:hypothetical protein